MSDDRGSMGDGCMPPRGKGYCGYYDTETGKIVNDVKKDYTTDDDPCHLDTIPPSLSNERVFFYGYHSLLCQSNAYFSSTDSQNEWMIVSIIIAIGSCIVIAVIFWWSRRTSDPNSQEQARINGKEAVPLTNEQSDASAAVSSKEDTVDEKRTSDDITSIAVYGKEFVYRTTPAKHVYSSGSSSHIHSAKLVSLSFFFYFRLMFY
ncbi:uncharacterized protein LOC134246654 [Saccostrea cucullata]|uniref:uncharacterized protein LOC134246654 n=1 Tax=Saccostrea cuccullata TaxID=36930 RepID=UPI002ED2F583